MGNTVVVIGGGASGLMAGITAARAGAKVTILEQNSKIGKKILSTGNGRCNITNLNQKGDYYRSNHTAFPYIVLQALPVEDTLSFFQSIGIFTKDKNGYVYPRSNQAASVVEALAMEVRHLKIKCKTQEKVVKIEKTEEGFSVFTESWHYDCDRVILACGSNASVVEGSDGSGYMLTKELGHSIVKPLPALTGLKGVGNWFSKWTGVRCDAAVSLYIDGEWVISDKGEVQLTDYGLSGIPVFQISRFASRALNQNKQVSVSVDFVPDMTKAELLGHLNDLMQYDENKNVKNLLIGFLPQKLVDVVVDHKNTMDQVVDHIKEFSVQIKATMDFSHAQVCTGGVECTELDPDTMESRLVPGIYVCGELVDVDGACGGYNLQWAWSSGYLAGMSAAKELL